MVVNPRTGGIVFGQPAMWARSQQVGALPNPMRSVALSPAQVGFLIGVDYLPTGLRSVVAAAARTRSAAEGVTLKVDGEVAERFRSAFTDRLVRVGFDPNYALTDEGVLLEKLIDAFFDGTE